MSSFTKKKWRIITYNEGFDNLIDFLEKPEKNNVNLLRDLPNLKEAVDLILEFVKNQKKITIIGDYDADGMSGTAILMIVLKKLKANVDYYIPNRFTEGYGFTPAIIEKLKDTKLIITIDNGTTSYGAIDETNKLGIKTIIIDHHALAETINPTVFINPYLNNKLSYLCGTGLSFLVGFQIIKTTNIDINPYDLIDITAIATVCDIMPVVGLNKIFIKKGIEKLKKNPRTCYKLILKDTKDIDINTIGFLIGPYINAAGRFGKPEIIINMIISEDIQEITNYYQELSKLVIQRKIEEEKILKQINFIEKKEYIIGHNDDLHIGVIGITASRVKDKFNKSSIIISWDNLIGKASVRSKNNLNTGSFIKEAVAKNILVNGGGHKIAGGFTIEKNKLNEFIEFLDNFPLSNEEEIIDVHLISFLALNKELAIKLQTIIPDTLLLIRGCKIKSYQIIKNQHLLLEITDEFETKIINGIIFNPAEKNMLALTKNNLLNLVGSFRLNNNQPQFLIIDGDFYTE